MEQEGITVDIIREEINFRGVKLIIADSSGLSTVTDPMHKFQKRKISEEATKADKIIFVVDGTAGVLLQDLEILNFLRENNFIGKTVLVVNKADRKDFSLIDFFEFGIDRIYPISAKEGRDVYELLEEIVENKIEKKQILPEEEKLDHPMVSIVGKPNVGKSTLFNEILNEERVLVSEKEFTTRDSIRERIEFNGNEYIFIDTAGLRSSKLREFSPIYLSMKRTESAIISSDIILFMVDGSEEIVKEDQRIGRIILEKKKGCIILVNKSDLIKGKDKVLNKIKEKLKFLYFAPIHFISAKNSRGIKDTFSTIDKVYESYKASFRTTLVNKILQSIVLNTPFPEGKIFYATQISTMPPKFLIFVNSKTHFKDSYLNFLKKNLIGKLSLVGTSVELELRGRREK